MSVEECLRMENLTGEKKKKRIFVFEFCQDL